MEDNALRSTEQKSKHYEKGGNRQYKMKQALDRIEHCLETIDTDKDWLQYLCFQSKFYNYSFGNAILIFSQNPQATFVRGYKAWNELGRYVKKGSKGLAIIAPCTRKAEVSDEADNNSINNEAEVRELSGFRVVYVYDIADTDGSDEYLPTLVKGLKGNGEAERQLYENLYAFISKEHVVNEVSGISANGYYNLDTKVICVRSDLDYMQKIKTLLHEYAHYVDFDLEPGAEVSRSKREVIAESVAFVVSMRLGIDTSSYSMCYIKSWLKDIKELKSIADKVQKVSAKIINELAEADDFTFLTMKECEE